MPKSGLVQGELPERERTRLSKVSAASVSESGGRSRLCKRCGEVKSVENFRAKHLTCSDCVAKSRREKSQVIPAELVKKSATLAEIIEAYADELWAVSQEMLDLKANDTRAERVGYISHRLRDITKGSGFAELAKLQRG
ncbi:MAG: hypothetical protein DCC49_01150 [Acidobacteria bacterium]|nr:MAG: hypothetical protein DCC49_01150 [Acidobacteriota bacterium]